MLILVGVTVSVALNGGLFTTAKEAKDKTQVEADREELLSAVVSAIGTDGKVDFSKLPPAGWTGSDGTYTSPKGNTFTVDYDGTINGPVIAKDLTELEKYILGENGEGGVELFGEEGKSGILNSDASFINVPEELQNNGGLTFKTYVLVSSSDEIVSYRDGENTVESNGIFIDWYFTYNGGTYKFRTLSDENLISNKTVKDIGVKEISYDKTTRVGKTVNYDNKEWVILYDDSVHGLQMISKDPLKKNNSNIQLGCDDETLNGVEITKFEEHKAADLYLEKAVYSYNNAVKTLNDVCKELVTPKEGVITGVRSVGSKAIGDAYADEVELYTQKEGDTNTNLIKWPLNSGSYNAGVGNGKGKTTDMNYEEDFDRMVALGINAAGSSYWLASRFVQLSLNVVDFGVRASNEGFEFGASLWHVHKDNASWSYSCIHAVRPVVSLRSDALVPATSGESYDYTIVE